jgi:hypothetical protein
LHFCIKSGIYSKKIVQIKKVIEADNLLVGFAEEDGGRVLVNSLSSSDASFIPQGLIHFEMNLGCKPAKYLSIHNTKYPGVVTISSRGFNLPIEVLQATYYMSEKQIESIRNYLPSMPTAGVSNFGFDECLAHCKLDKDSVEEEFIDSPY